MNDRVPPAELRELLESDHVRVLDVRSWLEFQTSHIPGATFVGLPRAMARPDSVPVDGADLVVLICLSGHRSRLPMTGLRNAFPGTRFVDLEGGMIAWWGHTRQRERR